jgi:lipopolysaccharide export LptBFGC system permease protein LptF
MPPAQIREPNADNYDEITIDSCDEDWQHEFEDNNSDASYDNGRITELEQEEDSVILEMMDGHNYEEQKVEELDIEGLDNDPNQKIPGFTFLGAKDLENKIDMSVEQIINEKEIKELLGGGMIQQD